MSRQYKIIVLLIIVASLFLFANPAYALDLSIFPEPCPEGQPCGPDNTCAVTGKVCSYCAETGSCGLNDFIEIFVKISKIILGILGAVALLFFIYGGIMWLTSGGSADKIKKGKDILVGTVIGLVLVFGAYAIVSFVQTAIGLKWGRLPAGGGGGGDVATGPTGCCIYEVGGEYGTENILVTSEDCDRYIASVPDVVSHEWFLAEDHFECRIEVSMRNHGDLALPDVGCCVPFYDSDIIPMICEPASTDLIPCLSGMNHYPDRECRTISSCDIRYCMFDGDCEEGTVVTCMGRTPCPPSP